MNKILVLLYLFFLLLVEMQHFRDLYYLIFQFIASRCGSIFLFIIFFCFIAHPVMTCVHPAVRQQKIIDSRDGLTLHSQ